MRCYGCGCKIMEDEITCFDGGCIEEYEADHGDKQEEESGDE